MRLTQKQESLITRYLRDVAMGLDDTLPGKQREAILSRLQSAISRELDGLQKDTIEDADVSAVLARVEASSRATPAPSPAPRSRPGARRLLSGERIWLGVCEGLAERAGLEAWQVRLLFFVAGIFTGPLAVAAYIAAFAQMYFGLPKELRPEVNVLLCAWRGGSLFVIAILLDQGVTYALQGIRILHERLLDKAAPGVGEWAWIMIRQGELIFWAVAVSVPLGVLSGLPLANGWGHSLKRAAQAWLALYATVLCFGIAAYLVGLILNAVDEFGGISGF